jgi:hypothetical protein
LIDHTKTGGSAAIVFGVPGEFYWEAEGTALAAERAFSKITLGKVVIVWVVVSGAETDEDREAGKHISGGQRQTFSAKGF